jgi:hypothetical protein
MRRPAGPVRLLRLLVALVIGLLPPLPWVLGDLPPSGAALPERGAVQAAVRREAGAAPVPVPAAKVVDRAAAGDEMDPPSRGLVFWSLGALLAWIAVRRR